MTNRKSRLDTSIVVVLIIAVLQQVSACYGHYLYCVETGSVSEYINDFVVSIPFYAVLYLGAPLLIRCFVNKGPATRKEGIGISVALLIVLYLIQLMLLNLFLYPAHFGLDLPITFTLIGYVILTIPQERKAIEAQPASNNADALIKAVPSIIEVSCSDNTLGIHTERIPHKEELYALTCIKCGNTISSDMSYCPYCGGKTDFKNDFNGSSEKEKSNKRVAIILIAITAVIVIAGLVVYCNYDNWKLQKIETELTTTTAIENGDIEFLEDLKAEYKSYGGDVDTFNSLIQEDIEHAFIRAIDARDSDKFIAYKEYLSKIGYTADMISNLTCYTNVANTYKAAVRENNDDVVIECLSILIDAGITYEDGESLYNDALR